MNAKKIAYWAITVLFTAMMAMSTVMYFQNSKEVVEGFAHLGYPPYFRFLLGTAKALGVLALLAPGLAILKEWAYCGFTITLISAAVSHLASGDGPAKAIGPVIGLVLLAVSYFLRPASRRLPPARATAA
jgi:hypothetical protein